ncbi:hypothetical protein B1806_16395, partial [Metallibacterium scheffleri]
MCLASYLSRSSPTGFADEANFLVNEEPGSFAMGFARQHGPCASGFAIRFSKPAPWVRTQALGHGGGAIGLSRPHNAAVPAGV